MLDIQPPSARFSYLPSTSTIEGAGPPPADEVGAEAGLERRGSSSNESVVEYLVGKIRENKVRQGRTEEYDLIPLWRSSQTYRSN